MEELKIENPFGGRVYWEETVSSTFDVARLLAEKKEGHGLVITADFQEAGRGRLNRSWKAERGESLLFTILLCYKDFSSIPGALTLRTGLAVSEAIEEVFPALKGHVMVKWPNDIIIKKRKIVGILTEADGNNVYIGVGINLAQKEFPEELRHKAGGIFRLIPEADIPIGDVKPRLLGQILIELHKELEGPALNSHWKERLLERLYMKNQSIVFINGISADNENPIEIKGILSGIGGSGELLIIPEGEDEERAFITGELRVY
ncbi:MAG: biotin--[acetyl-CoA-carboxylase] ligase [Treponema sp.]|nr:biotin--[acetyl-CoA-carboxylase] ligase [Treponema sp.]